MTSNNRPSSPSARRPNHTLSMEESLIPTIAEICVMGLIIVFYLIFDSVAGTGGINFANRVGPMAMAATLIISGLRMIWAYPRLIWTALFWFRLSTAAYFGFGTFAVTLLDDATLTYVESFFAYIPQEVLKMNLVVSSSVFLVLLTSFCLFKITNNSSGRTLAQTHSFDINRSLLIIAFAFLFIGLGVDYGLTTPKKFGWIDVQIPGFIMDLSRVTMVGIFMMTLWCLERAPKFLPMIFTLLGVELFFQILRFNKSAMLMTLILFLLAFLWNRMNFIRLAICATLIVSMYWVAVPIVSQSRAELSIRHGAEGKAGFADRFDILRNYFDAEVSSENQGNSTQDALTRVSYVNAATFVISEYDNGYPADWPSLLPAVFVPRVLWADKPIISDVGIDIYELGMGRRGSAMGAGIFADMYWAWGWSGVWVFSIILGAIMTGLTAISARILREGRWLYFPVVLMGLRIGFRADGHYLVDVAGGTVILLGTYLVLKVIDLIIQSVFSNQQGSNQHSAYQSRGLGAARTLNRVGN